MERLALLDVERAGYLSFAGNRLLSGEVVQLGGAIAEVQAKEITARCPVALTVRRKRRCRPRRAAGPPEYHSRWPDSVDPVTRSSVERGCGRIGEESVAQAMIVALPCP